MNFDEILKLYKTKTCILSVEDLGEGRYDNIRIVAGNKAHADDVAKMTGRCTRIRSVTTRTIPISFTVSDHF